MKYFTVLALMVYSLSCPTLIAQSPQKPGGIDEYWSTVPSVMDKILSTSLDGLVPTDRTQIIGIGTEDLDGNAKVTVASNGGNLYSIISDQKSSEPFNFGILSQVDSENSKAFASKLTDCETFHILGSGHLEGKSLKIFENGWCDYVFNKDYDLLPLKDLKSFIIQQKHLPEIKRESEVNVTGVKVYEMNKLLLKKIEELTLHVIAKQEELNIIQAKLKN